MTTRNRTTGISEATAALLIQPDWEAVERTCPNCGAEMDAISCKLKCPRCDYYKSCSDF